MEKTALKKYLSDKYQGWDSFCETIVIPIFGKDDYVDKRKKEVLDMKPERRLLADATGIRSVKFCAQTYVSGEPLQFFDITVSDKVMMERNRVNVQKIIRSVMDQYSSAFMIFHYDDESRWEWRFSFCYKSENEDESTDRKRYTFLLGPGQSCRTATDNFMALYDKRQKNEYVELEDLINAFNVEALSNEFFNGYKSIYEDIIEYVTGKRMVKVNNKWEEKVIHEPNEEIMLEFSRFSDPEKAVRDYVKKLMGRLVFLQFLQKKGWLGVLVNEKWGTGKPNFMQELFNKTEDKKNFIDNVLEVLFNDLNTERTNDLASSAVGSNIRVPYLNGGLFERDVADETRFPLEPEYMDNLFKFFSNYNFTIDENDPNDAEVGVDPEMLGRIFENLLEDNKDKGAFYTPKEIVTYMCRESLIAYLQTDVEDDPTKEAIRQFVTTHDATTLGNIADDIDQRLKDVKICDPAIGSGAFPMGLLKELFLCRTALEGIEQSKSAEIKKHIIQQNIYGVDIERGAVDIARLRFWLSLIVDEETPQALPNLDFKIMQGNSLLEQYKGTDLSIMTDAKWNQTESLSFFDNMLDVLRRDLRIMIAQYYECTNHKEKLKLKAKIVDNVKRQLSEQHIQANFDNIALDGNNQFFLWHTWFHDVFSQGGFDIVIGNPPYGAKTTTEEKKAFKYIYNSAKTVPGVQKGSTDTFSIFIDFGFKSIKNKGISMFIVPLSITASDSMSGLHKLLIDHCDEIKISSYGDRPKRIFESAEQQVSIIQFRKSGRSCQKLLTTPINKRFSDESLWILLNNLKFINTLGFVRNGRIPKIGDTIELSILSKLRKIRTELSSLYSINGTPIYYRKAGGRYYKVIMKEPTYSAAEGKISVQGKYANLIGASLSSTLFYWFWLIHSDWHNLRTSELAMFPIPYTSYCDDELSEVKVLYDSYLKDLNQNSKVMKSGLRCYYARQSKSLIDKIDKYIGKKYGLTDAEIEFIINYDSRYRNSGD